MMLTVNLKQGIIVLVTLLSLSVTVVLWAYSQHDDIKQISAQHDQEVVKRVNTRSDKLFVLQSAQSRLEAHTENNGKQLDKLDQKIDKIDDKLDILILKTR